MCDNTNDRTACPDHRRSEFHVNRASLNQFQTLNANSINAGKGIVRVTAIGCVALIALLSGCATSTDVAFKPDDRASIRTVSVNSTVKKPDRMTCLDNTTRWTTAVAGAPGGIVVGVVVAGVAGSKISKTNSSGMQLEQAMAGSGIMVDRIVRDTFTEELRKSGALAVTSASGDAQFNLAIRTYGLTVGSNIFDRKLAPNLAVTAELVRHDGILVWKDAWGAVSVKVKLPRITYLGRDDAHLFEEYLNNPQLLRGAFTVAAQAVARGLVANLNRQ